MKKVRNRTLPVILIVFLALQFFQPALNTDHGKVYPADFTRTYKIPAEVETILKASCYDCHSNNTNYLWYDYVQPARWLVNKHIREAKKELNFNEWGSYSNRKQERLLRSAAEQVETGQMPLRSYTLLHKNAVLTKEQSQVLIKWLKEQP